MSTRCTVMIHKYLHITRTLRTPTIGHWCNFISMPMAEAVCVYLGHKRYIEVNRNRMQSYAWTNRKRVPRLRLNNFKFRKFTSGGQNRCCRSARYVRGAKRARVIVRDVSLLELFIVWQVWISCVILRTHITIFCNRVLDRIVNEMSSSVESASITNKFVFFQATRWFHLTQFLRVWLSYE